MKIQQISRFRLGEQGRDSGYQIAGASRQITQTIEMEFTGMYTTVKVTEDIEKMLPYTLDCGYDINNKNFYMTIIYPKKDFKGRGTPYTYGIVLDEEACDYYFKKPEDFFRFSLENFPNEIDAFQNGRTELPELTELILDSDRKLNIHAIRQKYKLTDEIYEDLIRHIYEVVLSENASTLQFGWDQPLSTFDEVIKDMMFLAFSVMPMVLRKKITFSNYRSPGLSSRMFTVVPEQQCQSSNSAWFNLVTGESSQLKEDIDGTRYKTMYISHIAAVDNCEEFLNHMDGFLKSIFKSPELKMISTIANAMLLGFYAYSDKIIQSYFKPTNAGKILNTVLNLKVDDSNKLYDLCGKLLGIAISIDAKINDVQFKKLQKHYFETKSAIYEKAFAEALATRGTDTVKKMLTESIKEPSSKKTDDFIAFLLVSLSSEENIITEEVVKSLEKRYPVTESEELMDYYLDYVNNLYSAEMTSEDASKLIRNAINYLENNRESSSYERAAIYMGRQLEQVKNHNLILNDSTLQELLKMSAECENDYDISDSILEYYIQVYMKLPIGEAIRYYGLMLQNNKDIAVKINKLLTTANSNVQDAYYARKYFPKACKNIRSSDDFKNQLRFVHSFPNYKESEVAIHQYLIDSLRNELIMPVSAEMNDKKNLKKEGNDRSKGIPNEILYPRYKKLIKKVEEVVSMSEQEQYHSIIEKLKKIYWDNIDINSVVYRFYKEQFSDVDCDNDNCIQIKCYWDNYDEFAKLLESDREFKPSTEMITALTTTTYISSIGLVQKRLDSLLNREDILNRELSFDVLLMKYYDLEKKKLKETDFLNSITSRQRAESDPYESNMLLLNESLKNEVNKIINKRKRRNGRTSNSVNKNKILLFGGIGVLLIIIAVALVVFFTKGKKEDIHSNPTAEPTETVTLEPTAEPTETVTLEPTTEPETEFSVESSIDNFEEQEENINYDNEGGYNDSEVIGTETGDLYDEQSTGQETSGSEYSDSEDNVSSNYYNEEDSLYQNENNDISVYSENDNYNESNNQVVE